MRLLHFLQENGAKHRAHLNPRAPETTMATICTQHPYISDTIPTIPVWSTKSDIWTLGCSLFGTHSRLPNRTALFTNAGDAFHIHDVGPVPPLYSDILHATLPSRYPCGAKVHEHQNSPNIPLGKIDFRGETLAALQSKPVPEGSSFEG